MNSNPNDANPSQERLILVGRVLGALGLRGEVKIESWTNPIHAILSYQPWLLKSSDSSPRLNTPKSSQTFAPNATDPNQLWIQTLLRDGAVTLPQNIASTIKGRQTSKGVSAKIAGVDDRTAAEALRGFEIYVARSQLPAPQTDEVYWVDLEGMTVVNLQGISFGTITHLFDTGANDVVVVRDSTRERMIPFIRPQFISNIDFESNTMTVDWDADF